METISVAKRTSRKKPLTEAQLFLQQLQLLFSSMTARSCPYAYFNVYPDMIVLSNSTTPKATEHGDRLMNYTVPELSIHVVQLKDSSLEQHLRALLAIPDTGYYCVHVLNLLKVLKKFEESALTVFLNENQDTVLVNKGRKTYDDCNVVGWTVTNHHVVRELHKYVEQMIQIGTTRQLVSMPCQICPVDLNITLCGRVYFTTIAIDVFKDEQGQLCFPDSCNTANVLCLDGLTSVSIKEFIRRVSDEPYTFTRYLWVVGGGYILMMTLFENATMQIRSMRPNVVIVPIPKMTMTSTTSLLNFEEISDE